MPVIDYCVYDCETQKMAQETEGGWNNIYGMDLASCVVWDSLTQQYHFFGPGDEERQRCCKYMHKRICVSFNGVGFDTKLLLGNKRTLEGNKVSNGQLYWYELDIYLEIMKKIMGRDSYKEILSMSWNEKKKYCQPGVYKLGNIAANTIHAGKNGESEDGPKFFKSGNFAKLFEYNLQDVRVLKLLKEFIDKYRYIVNGNYDIVKF